MERVLAYWRASRKNCAVFSVFGMWRAVIVVGLAEEFGCCDGRVR